ncbi:EF-hand calcium-binding domain-containing protein 12 [Spea bombifrons]|uniref:EF-hand calcium-binding domain-containing protein 12 n=1 Tax=Spea bombifrons TaxID=233779 RepID=UPI002349EC11|nr:EF-hand calcium-binding domain-containing protein 12 [Spea bombifrons]
MAGEVTFKDFPMSEEMILKQYRRRDLSHTHAFRMACSKSGPPKSRTRRIIAPPMEKVESWVSQPGWVIPMDPNNNHKPETVKTGITKTETGQSCSDWIAARKKFRQQLDSMGDVEEFLNGKPVLTELETQVEERIIQERSKTLTSHGMTPDTEVQEGMLEEKSRRPMSVSVMTKCVKSQVTESSFMKSPQSHIATPTLQSPSPDGLGIMDNYLHQRRLRLMDLYNQTDKTKKKNISTSDLKAVRKEAGLPINDCQVEHIVISLSGKTPNYVNYKELSRGRSAWKKENMEEHLKNITSQPLTSHKGQKSMDTNTQFAKMQHVQSKVGEGSRRGSSPQYSEQSEESNRSQFLQVPPTDLGEKRSLSYEEMEDVIKHYRDRKRRAKSSTPCERWSDQSRTIRTWNDAVDTHSQPSTLSEEMGEKVDAFRRKCLWQYHEISKLCQIYKVALSEKLLERALLHPGDRWIHASGQSLQIRQPGTAAFSTKDVPKNHILALKEFLNSGNTGKETHGGIPAHTPYPPKAYVNRIKTRVRGNAKTTKETLNCWVTFEQFQGMICNLKRKHTYCFRATEDNAFWPGHLLEKLCLYLPQATQTQLKP